MAELYRGATFLSVFDIAYTLNRTSDDQLFTNTTFGGLVSKFPGLTGEQPYYLSLKYASNAILTDSYVEKEAFDDYVRGVSYIIYNTTVTFLMSTYPYVNGSTLRQMTLERYMSEYLGVTKAILPLIYPNQTSSEYEFIYITTFQQIGAIGVDLSMSTLMDLFIIAPRKSKFI